MAKLFVWIKLKQVCERQSHTILTEDVWRPNFFFSGLTFFAELAQEYAQDLATVCSPCSASSNISSRLSGSYRPDCFAVVFSDIFYLDPPFFTPFLPLTDSFLASKRGILVPD